MSLDQPQRHLRWAAMILREMQRTQLRSLHVTGGYREGIAVSKEKHMQEGFDEGYTLGAELGLKAGWCLGALEGIGHALAASTVSHPAAEKTSNSDQNDLITLDSTRKLLEAAEEELKVENLFGRTYFGEDVDRKHLFSFGKGWRGLAGGVK
ncbi:hypothetical protein KC333_g159 [Hortaea werneckii]|nr:hypothetical protein KC333_g159 [Hortaea werneckii]